MFVKRYNFVTFVNVMIEILAITSYWNFVVPAVSVILPMYVLIVVISFCISVETRSWFFFPLGLEAYACR